MSARNELGRRVQAIDVLSLSLAPTALLATFALPRSVRYGLALEYARPTLLTLYTMHFVHLEAGHLLTNVAVYALVVPLAYALAALSDRRGLFYAGFLTFLLAFPFALSALNVLIVRPRVGLGFSGINMAFLGFLPLVLVSYVEARVGAFDAAEHAPVLFFAGAALVGLLTIPYSRVGGLVVGIAAVAVVAYVRPLWVESDAVVAAARRASGRPVAFELVCSALAVFVAVIVAAFPSDPGARGLLNVYLHVLGYCLGFVVPYVALRIAEV